MNPLDALLPIVGVLATFLLPTFAVPASYRRARPYKVVGHSPATGMVAVRWRDDPSQTHWYTPDHLAQQKGFHR